MMCVDVFLLCTRTRAPPWVGVFLALRATAGDAISADAQEIGRGSLGGRESVER